jgi:septal ring factor EnvC (AmiA/AmiB activator)
LDVELLLPVLAAAISMVAGGISSSELVRKAVRRVLGKPTEEVKSYSERLAELTTSLTKSTEQVDAVLAELVQVAKEREATVQSLEVNLAGLEGHEKDLQARIDALQQVPLPAVEHFAKLLESGEKKSAWRDYMLFGAGVVVSTVIAIGLKVLGLG